jgi:hypothetical protein
MQRPTSINLMRVALFFFIMASGALSLQAQTFHKEAYGIPVTANGSLVHHPFVGGFYNPMHQFADIDLDGDADLFLYELNDGTLSFYRNTGSAEAAQFMFERDPFPIPLVFGWFRLEDIDGDGLLDFTTSTLSGNTLAIHLNSGTPESPSFTLLTEALLDSAGEAVYAESFSIAAFADLDADNDLDFLSLNSSLGTINYYENIGDGQNFLLAFRTDRYQDIQICIGCFERQGAGERHGNGTMYFGDIDMDNDFDMLYGDMFDQGLFFYENIGTPQNAVLDSITAEFPPDDPVVTGGFNQPTLADIDDDGDPDMFVSVLFPLERVDNFRLYLNSGTPQAYEFALTNANYLGTLDFGLQSAPTFADIDADGDPDLFVGNLDGQVALMRNTGSPAVPVFVLEDSFFVSSTTTYTYAPRFADIDADLDLDMFLGHFGGKIEFYRNTGTPAAPTFERELWVFDTLTVGNYAAPAFFDDDADGDLDLFVGRALGTISHYRNHGTPQVPSFLLENASYLGVSLGSNTKPEFFDEDGDGDQDLLIGASDGKLYLYRNDGSAGNPVFVSATTAYADIDSVREGAPAVIDIDLDTDADLVMGNYRGGLELYLNDLISSVPGSGGEPIPAQLKLYQNFPNPFNPVTSITYSLPGSVFVTMKIYDVLGREVSTLVNESKRAGTHSVIFDASRLPSGAYFCHMHAGTADLSMKLLVLK